MKVFEAAKKLELKAPPHLATRVMAEVREREARRDPSRLWKRFSAALGVGLAAVLAWNVALLNRSESNFTAPLGEVMVVRVETLKNFEIAQARILLPDGVEFSSQDFPQIRERRSLTLQWKKEFSGDVLPVLVRGTSAGERTVIVQFLDLNQEIISERRISIHFKGGSA
jgi:hypothetical protein